MSAVKDYIMGIEELVVTALERGAKDFDSIFAYVYMYDNRADTATVAAILSELHDDHDLQLSID